MPPRMWLMEFCWTWACHQCRQVHFWTLCGTVFTIESGCKQSTLHALHANVLSVDARYS